MARPWVVIYCTPTCGYCRTAKAFLSTHGIPYTEYNVAQDERRYREMFEKSGQWGVPVLDVGGEILVGFNEDTRERLSQLFAPRPSIARRRRQAPRGAAHREFRLVGHGRFFQ